MGFKEIYGKIRHDHGLMMLVCCIFPLLLLIGAVYFFGFSKSYLSWFILLLCPLMHFFMMKHMHKHDKGQDGGKIKSTIKMGVVAIEFIH